MFHAENKKKIIELKCLVEQMNISVENILIDIVAFLVRILVGNSNLHLSIPFV